MIRILLSPLLLGLTAWPACAQKLPPNTAVQALSRTEFAFAADALKRGTKPAFLATMADSAVFFTAAAPVSARAHWLAKPEPDSAADPVLRWAPALVGASTAGDLGYTTGPWLLNAPRGKALAAGQFFTVWARQPNGIYRWLLDTSSEQGVLPKKKWLTPEYASVERGPASTRPKAGEARPTPRALDEELSTDMATQGMVAAYETRLLPESRLLRDAQPVITTVAAIRQQVSTETPRRLTPIGGRTAASGDLAYSYGQYQTETSAPTRGSYVHLWLHTAAGWQLLVEVISPATAGK